VEQVEIETDKNLQQTKVADQNSKT